MTIGISSSDTTEGTVSTTSLTFTTANWMTPQTVTVTGVDDYIVDGDVAYTVVTAAAVSADGNYSGLNASDVSVTNTDNDTFNTIYVDTNSDTSDGDTSSIAALYAGKGLDGKISLREAITAANNTSNGPGGPDRIYFNIDGTGVHTISPGSALPNITSPVIIDGYTQHGASVNTLAVGDNAVLQIELNGTGAGSNVTGLTLNTGSSGSTISGLVINRFNLMGINVQSSSNIIAGNFIGTTSDGTAASSNYILAMQITASGNLLGGDTPAARNVICGGSFGHASDISLSGTNNTIQGNYIGTNAAGTANLSASNGPDGIDVSAGGNTIGGTTAGAGNLISGHWGYGISISGSSTSNTIVQGNLIGTNATGTAKIGNSTGIGINSGGSNTIGGTTAAAANVISGNSSGILITGSSRHE